MKYFFPFEEERMKNKGNLQYTKNTMIGLDDGVRQKVCYDLYSLWHSMNTFHGYDKYMIELPEQKSGIINIRNNNRYGRTHTESISRIILSYMREGNFFLESCCGWAVFSSIAKYYGFSGLGIDIWEVALEHSRKQIKYMKGKGDVQIIEMDAMNLEFDNVYFDIIYCNPPFLDEELYHKKYNNVSSRKIEKYLENIQRLAIENYRVLKKNGLCIMTINDTRKKGVLIPLHSFFINIFFEIGFILHDIAVMQVRSHRIRLRKKDYNLRRTVKGHEYILVFKKE